MILLSSQQDRDLTFSQVELQNNDQSDKMSRKFLELKRDIEAFVNRFNLSARETAIDPMLKDIELYVSNTLRGSFL